MELGGNAPRDLQNAGVEFIQPDIQDYVTPQGTWNGNPVVLELRYQGQTYNSTAEVLALLEQDPNLSQDALDRAENALSRIDTVLLVSWNEVLTSLSSGGQQTVPLFQLEPNTLLSEASSTKVFFEMFSSR